MKQWLTLGHPEYNKLYVQHRGSVRELEEAQRQAGSGLMGALLLNTWAARKAEELRENRP